MKELMIHLQANSDLALYEQIYKYIKNSMMDGKIAQGERLPSTRLLATHLQVSRSTIELAYEQLVSEGYIKPVPGSGYFACAIGGVYQLQKDEHHDRADAYGQRKIDKATHVGEKRGKAGREREKERAYAYDFSPNVTEWSEFSMNAWRKASKLTLQGDTEKLFLTGSPLGEEKLRQAICGYLYHARGVNSSAHQIIIGAGNEYLLMLLSQMLPGISCVAMESPTYGQAYHTFCNLNWKVSPIAMDASGICLEPIRKKNAQLIYVMPSHQFPIGTIMPMNRRMELLNWAGQKEGRYIIEDDYDSEFRYKGRQIPSLQGNDQSGSVIYLGTFSKSIAPAIRVSYMVLPLKLMEIYHSKCGFYSSTVSRIQQETLFHFMEEGYFERHLNKMRGIYKTRHDCLLSELKKCSWVAHIFGENAGLHLLVQVHTGKTEEAVTKAAQAMDVRVYGLKEYMIGNHTIEEHKMSGCPTFILGFAGLTEKEIVEGMKRLDTVLK
ncbi:PLP-dependent aminotransferase family protein [Lachnospiraceae bacterium ZAX-1]